ncbi:MAG TPA: hypothetical protein VF072_16975 [Thermoleophilaceae bacterium]
MKSFLRGRRPSPALIVASLALFVSLSGVSYGVATGFIDSREIKNNEVRSIDIRNNEIRTKDLRNNEVRGIDIRNSTVQGRDIALNTVTGEDVKEDTLQKVPSALLADSATSADAVKTLKTIPLTAVAEGSDPVVLATHGPLTVKGECATGTVARLTVSTTEAHSAAAGQPGTVTPDVDPTDGDVQIAMLAGPTSPAYAVASVAAFAPSGKGLTGDVALYRDASGSGSCRFHGSLGLQG